MKVWPSHMQAFTILCLCSHPTFSYFLPLPFHLGSEPLQQTVTGGASRCCKLSSCPWGPETWLHTFWDSLLDCATCIKWKDRQERHTTGLPELTRHSWQRVRYPSKFRRDYGENVPIKQNIGIFSYNSAVKVSIKSSPRVWIKKKKSTRALQKL